MRTSTNTTDRLPRGRIEVRDLVLEYPSYRHIIADRLRYLVGMAVPSLRPPMHRVLDGVNFSIEPGEVLGLVGRNGAGKTSMLKVISGLVPPSFGSAEVGGRVMALLAMGVGFRQTYTGRENIAYGGLLLGMTAPEISARMEAIVEFAELASQIDQPYFTYSSGMRARLAFALATHVTADIVILDETLATGDLRFASKCYRKLHEIRKSGTTVIFVSHNLGEIARLTSRVIVLEGGKLRYDGDVFGGLDLYERLLIEARAKSGDLAEGMTDVDVRVDLLDQNGHEASLIRPGRPVEIAATVTAQRDLGPSWVYLRVINVENNHLTFYLMMNRWQDLVEHRLDCEYNVDIRQGQNRIVWSIPHWVVGEGTYTIDAYVGPPVTAGLRDVSGGRVWRAAARLVVAYENHLLKGANSLLEMPVASVRVLREHAGALSTGKVAE